MADFNKVARFYDLLKKVVFGNQIEIASTNFLNGVQENAKILIIGGGSGKLLESFSESHQIKFVDSSSSMIEKAKQVNSKASVEFIVADILEWDLVGMFDLILTPFILDCFNIRELNSLLPKLRNNLDQNGSWIQTDFYPKNSVQKSLVRIMYFFFRITAKLEVEELADFDQLFKKYNFICTRKALFFHSMIESKIYRQIE